MSATRAKDAATVLRSAVTRAERLAQRNRAQATRLRRGAAAMADHATTFLAENADAAERGDVDARADHLRATRERYRARQVAETDT